ncbi:MAG TPA: helix-turn-helix transcriptional regulator [Thermoanaerobaculia bacterium]
MNKVRRARLEAIGWKVGTVEEFLGLTADESSYIELRLKLSDAVRQLRKEKRVTQTKLAELISSSQSRIAKIEAADESVSIDLLIRSLLALGASHQDVARIIASPLDPSRKATA